MCLFSVKYLREVTPYFRKSSFLAEIGWTGPSVDASAESGSSGAVALAGDCRIIPLRLCFICRNVATPDVRNCTIELHSPDARSVICLRAADERTATRWYTALAAVAELATRSVIADANRLLSDDVLSSGTAREVRHIGWLAEKVNELCCYCTLSPVVAWDIAVNMSVCLSVHLSTDCACMYILKTTSLESGIDDSFVVISPLSISMH